MKPPPSFPPQLASRFHAQGLLGQGNMGAVFQALDLTTQRQVAIKLILGTADATGEARFAREGALTAALSHPNIVRLHESGVAGGLPYLVYELIEGARTFSEVGHLLAQRAAVELLRDAARAVGFAHARGVVHRDLKGANLLIDRAGRVRVADFGIAYAADLERLTQTGVLVGTPSIMAPEQMKPKPEPVPGTDVWAIGVLLYQRLCGRSPFDDRTLPQLIASVLADDPTPPSALHGSVPPGLEAICLRCLEKDPERRYPNGDALADDLQRALDGEEPQALAEEQAPAPLPPLVAAVVVAILGVVVLGLGAAHALGARGHDRAGANPSRGARSSPPRRERLWEKPEFVLDHHAQSGARGLRGAAGATFWSGGVLTYGAGLQLWSDEGRPIRSLGGPYVTRLARFQDGALAGGAGKGQGLWFLPALTRDVQKDEFKHLPALGVSDGTAVLAPFPQAGSFLVSGPEGPLQRVEFSSGKVLRSFVAPRPTAASVSPDGRTLIAAARASGGDPQLDRQVRSFYWVFETATGTVLKSGTISGQVRCLAHSPDGSFVVAGTSLGGLIPLSAAGDPDPRPFLAPSERSAHGRSAVRALAFHPRRTRLYSVALSPAGGQDELRVWRLPGRTLERSLRLRAAPTHLALDLAGQRLAIGYEDGVVEVWATE